MPRLKNPFICSICNEHGGTMGKGPVATSVQLPKLDRIIKVEKSPDHSGFIATVKLSDAFDFAAKMLLALEHNAILYPPMSKEEEDDFALAIYESVNTFDPHTDIERKLFETRWLKERFDKHSIESRIIKAEKNIAENDLKRLSDAIKKHQESGRETDDVPTMRIRTQRSDKMHVSRSSIACRYAAILLTAISKLVVRGGIPPLESESKYALAVYNMFNRYRYYVDDRYRKSLAQRAEILDIRIQHGYNAASSHSAGPALTCKRCYNQKKGEITSIDTTDADVMRPRVKQNGLIELYCIVCGGTETIVRKITTKNIKKMEGKAAAEIDRLAESVPIYDILEKWFSNELKQNDSLRRELKIEFQRQEHLSHKLSFHTPCYYYIQHHDPSKKGRKRRCWLNKENVLKISITDPAYKKNIDLLVDPSRSGNEESEQQQLRIMRDCIYRLMKLGYPEKYLEDKPVIDMFHARYCSLDSCICLIYYLNYNPSIRGTAFPNKGGTYSA